MKVLIHIFVFAVGFSSLWACSNVSRPTLPTRDGGISDSDSGDMPRTDMMTDTDGSTVAPDQGISPDQGPAPSPDGRTACGALTYPETQPIDSNASEWRFENVTELGNGFSGSCGGLGWESLVVFRAPRAGTYTAILTTNKGTSPVLHVRTECDNSGTEVGCSGTAESSERAIVSFDAETQETHYLFVDTWQAAPSVQYTLWVFYAENETAPNLDSAVGYPTDTSTTIKVTASDANGDIVAALLLNSASTEADATEIVIEDTDLKGRAVTTTIATQTNLSEGNWSLAIVDSSGLQSEYQVINMSTPLNVDSMGTCGRSRAELTTCPPDHSCSPDASGEERCQPETPPILEDVQIVRRRDMFTVAGRIQDPNLDVTIGLIDFLDETDNVIQQRAFPIQMGAPEQEFQVQLPTTQDLTTSAANITVVDDIGHEVQILALGIGAPQNLNDGTACDPDSYLAICQPPLGCVAGCETMGDGECSLSHQCRTIESPSVIQARIARDTLRQTLTTDITVEDPLRIFSHLHINQVEGAQQPIQLELLNWQRVADTTLTIRQRATLSNRTLTTDALRLTPVDRFGNEGTPVEIAIGEPETLDVNAPCDPEDASVRCPEQHACYATADAAAACRASTPPELTEARVYVREGVPYAGVRLTGTTGNADINLIRVRTRNIAADESEAEEYRYQLASEFSLDGSFDIRDRLPLSIFEQQDLLVELAVTDSRYLSSDWVTVETVAPPALVENDACYADTIFGLCAAGTYCQLASGEDFGLCLQGDSTCPENWSVQEETESPNQPTQFSGDTRSAFSTNVGACNAGGEAIIHAFVPVETRSYVARARGVGTPALRFPRLAAFSSCTRGDNALGCSPSSGVLFQGQAQTIAYIAVSAPPLGLDFQGNYELTVYPHEAPTLGEVAATATARPNHIRLELDIQPGTEDLTAVVLSVLDANGDPIWSVVNGETWNQGLLIDPSGVTASIDVDLSSYTQADPRSLQVKLLDILGGASEATIVALPTP